jgi:hypothetical protein
LLKVVLGREMTSRRLFSTRVARQPIWTMRPKISFPTEMVSPTWNGRSSWMASRRRGSQGLLEREADDHRDDGRPGEQAGEVDAELALDDDQRRDQVQRAVQHVAEDLRRRRLRMRAA